MGKSICFAQSCNFLHEYVKWTRELNFVATQKPMGITFIGACKFFHDHAKTTRTMSKCHQAIFISQDHLKLVILVQN